MLRTLLLSKVAAVRKLALQAAAVLLCTSVSNDSAQMALSLLIAGKFRHTEFPLGVLWLAALHSTYQCSSQDPPHRL